MPAIRIRPQPTPRRARAAAISLALAAAFALVEVARCAAYAPWTADPPGMDALWTAGLGVPQFDGDVTVAIRFGSGILAGGDFRVAGGVAAHCIALWDGARWQPLELGLPAPPVAMVAAHDTIWAAWNDPAGSYNTAGRIVAGLGSNWGHPIEGPPIQSFVIFGGQPTALVFGSSGYEVQRWTGSVWLPLGVPGSVASSGGAVLFTDGDSLYVGGQFRNDNTATSTPVLKVWDGSTWSVRASATAGPNSGYLLAIGSDAGRLVVGGFFPEIDGVPAQNVAVRQAGAWHAMGSGLSPQVSQLTDDGAGHLLAFGANASSPTWGSWPGVAQWNGAFWQLSGNDLFPAAQGIVASGGDLFAYGRFQQNGLLELHGFAQLRQSDASPVASSGAPLGGLGGTQSAGSVNAIASFRGTTVAAGAIGVPGDTVYFDGGRGVMALNGDRWHSITDGTYFSGRVLALLPFGDRLVAGGRFDMSLDFLPTRGIAQWDGTYWWPMGDITGQVDAFAVYRGTLYAGGDFGTADGLLCSSIAKWTGSRWLSVGPVVLDTGPVAPHIFAMTVWRDRLIVAGSFSNRGPVPAHNIAAWDGANWSELAGWSGRPITALAATDSVLYAGTDSLVIVPSGHSFILFPDIPVPQERSLNVWNGTQWSELPAPLNTGVTALSATPHGLMVGSNFTGTAGELFGLARFDGSSWYMMGSGVQGPTGFDCSAQAFAMLPDGLWVGGSFSVAGGKPSSRIARFDGYAPAVPPAGSKLVNAAPSPTTGAFTLRFRTVNAGRVRVSLFDITGRQVATIHDEVHAAGAVVIPWSGQPSSGGSLRSGIYLMRIESQGESDRTARIAIVR
jgi:hypothetical protein